MRLIKIKKHPNYWVSDAGDVYRYKDAKYVKLKPFSVRGYLKVTLDGVGVYVARLVLEHFKPTDNSKLKVYHIDRDKKNNKLTNLIWANSSEIQLYSSYTKEYSTKMFNRARE